jgi:hypothetical protein
VADSDTLEFLICGLQETHNTEWVQDIRSAALVVLASVSIGGDYDHLA